LLCKPGLVPYPARMAELRLPHGVRVPEHELHLETMRSSGPGGQGVNTTDSKVRLRWSVRDSVALNDTQRQRLLERLGPRLTTEGELLLESSEHRSQHRNREAVLARFSAVVGEALAPPTTRRRTRPSRGARRRRLEDKRHRAETKRLRRRPGT
jgi:ribosome-associated protein